MLLEAMAIGGCIWMLREMIGGEQRELKKKWKTSMMYANAVNHKKNNEGKSDPQTFEIIKCIKKEYGYDAIISIPFGLSYDDLEKYKANIETNLHCKVFFSKVKDSSTAYARIITIPFDELEPFEVVKTNKPYELYIGRTYYHTSIISDMRYHPHLITSGATGTGKSFLLFTILANLVNNNSEKDIELYLAQISAKQDLKAFSKLKHTRYYANNLEESYKMYAYLQNEMVRRNKLIYSIDGCNTIEDYNKKIRKDKRLPYIYIFADEFSYYMEDGTEQPLELQYKKNCRAMLVDFVKQGRSAGIFIIVCLQRPDKENIPPIFKSQINTRIALRQNNTASSLVVIDSGDAVDLEDREAIVLFGGKAEKFKTLYLSNEIMDELLKEHKLQTPNYVDISDYGLKEKEKGSKKGTKTKKIENNKETKTINPAHENDNKPKKSKKGVIGSVGAT